MEDKKDKFLEKMIRQTGPRKAPHGFAENVMKKIEASSSAEPEWSISRMSWILSVAGIAAAITIIFVLDLSFLENLFSPQQWDSAAIDSVGQQMVKFWENVQENLHLSSISLVIILSTAALLIIDRILRNRTGSTQYLSL